MRKGRVSVQFYLILPKLWGNCAFPQNFHTKKLGDITVFYQCLNIHLSALTHLSPSSTQLHLPPPSTLQPPPTSLQHPQQYSNQNIALNSAISPNLGQRIQSCPFWLKIGSNSILEGLIPNQDLYFWNSNPKIHFWPNLGPKRQSCPFRLKIGTHGISKMLILTATIVVFCNSDSKINCLGKFWPTKLKLSVLSKNWHTWYLKEANSYSDISFLKFRLQNSFLGKFGPKKAKLSVLSENWHTLYLKDADSYCNNSFLKFRV